MLFDIIDMVPKTYRAQPFAVISYIMWWMGQGRSHGISHQRARDR